MQGGAAAVRRNRKRFLKFSGFDRGGSSDDGTTTVRSESPRDFSSNNADAANSDSAEDVFYDSRQRRWQFPHAFPKWLRRPCGKIVEDKRFQVFIVLMIAINSAMMGIATYNVVEQNPEVSYWFEVADFVFLIIFTVELGLQVIHKDIRIFLDGWLVFDFVVVVLSWAFSSVQIMRAFRIFRAFRLVGRIEIMRSLVDACISVIPRLLSIALLLFLLFYIFGVMFTQLFMEFGEYFGRLDVTLFTLFQMMTMDGWADIAREVMDEYTWAWVPFVAFVVLSGFVVVNLIIAVICDAIFVLHELEEEKETDNSTSTHDDDDSDRSETDEKSESDASDRAESPRLQEKKKSMEEEVEDLTQQVEEMMELHFETRRALEELIKHLYIT